MTHRETVLEFFRAHPASCIRELIVSADRTTFADDRAYLFYSKNCHSRAHELWIEGWLARESKVDSVTGNATWHYTVNPSPIPVAQQNTRRMKLQVECDALKAERDALKAEVQSLLELLDSATLPQAA